MSEDGRRKARLDRPLDALLHPEVVAVVGVSSDQTKLGSVILGNVVRAGFPGRIYAVARASMATDGGVNVVRSLDDIPETVDLALFALPATALLGAVRSIPRHRVRLAVAIASGFSEVGAEGRQLEAELKAACEAVGVPLIGPNCQGVVVPGAGLQMTFSPMFNSMVRGPVAIVSQSGGLGAYMANRLMQRGTGVRCFVSAGNETCIDAADYIGLFGDDPATSVILCYLEHLGDGTRFVRAVRSLPPDKRIVIVKSGRTAAGVQAAATHTGALASDDDVVSGVFHELGILRASDSAVAVDAATALASGRTLRGRRVGVLSIAGGLAVELTDLLEMAGLEVPEFAESTRAELKTVVPAFGAIRNPIDLTGAVLSEGGKFRQSLEILSRADVDGFAIISTYVPDPQYAHAIVELFQQTNKPVIVCWTGTVEQTREALSILADAKVPVFDNTGRAAAAFAALLADATRVRLAPEEAGTHDHGSPVQPDVRRYLASWSTSGRTGVNEADAKTLLARAGLPLPRQGGYPGASVVKFCADSHLHKTEYGLVRLNVPTAALAAAREEMAQHAKEAGVTAGTVLVEECIDDGLLEWFVGFKSDPTFGPVVVFGAGGIFAETMAAPRIRLAPLDHATAVDLIMSHPAYPAIAGGRGRPTGDVNEFARVICRASEFFAGNADLIAEMDLNPIIVRPAAVAARGEPSVTIADAAFRLNQRSA
jgi:acyl-CoA synthetase (NDP forming)